MTQDIARALEGIRAQGSFSTRTYADPDALRLEVRGVGPIALPVTRTSARKLVKVARPAAYGWRDETRIDAEVRDTWEIAKSRVKIDARRWKKTLRPQLERIQAELGLPAEGELKAELHKLLVYEPGQFFAPHQDSEKAGDMVGTLVVTLPCTYTGGATIVEHRGEKVEYRVGARTKRELTLVAFYADCHHEVRPIKTGCRIALIYNLTYSGAAVEPAAPAQDRTIARLAGCVERHFATPVPRRFSSQPPEAPKKLVYLLDHDYTRHSLRWERLKNGDSARAAALRAVAERLDCEAFLAQADIHESWSCEGDDYGWGRRGYGRYGWDEDDDEDEGDDSDSDDESYELIELLDDDMELRHWIDAAGKPFKDAVGGVADSEVCFAKATVELQPFKSEHEGWMGNYGNTVDRWYRRAAVVLWPRSLAFAIRAEASPGWALDQLARLLKRGEAEDAEDKARSLLPMWERCAGGVTGKTFFAKVLRVASLLDDPEVAAGLVAPLCLGHMGRQAVTHVVRLLERHGLAWWRERFDRWLAGLQRSYGRLELEEAWAAFLPTLCRELRRRGAKAQDLARAIAAQQCDHVEQALKAALDPQRVRGRERDLADVSRAVVQLLLACEAADDPRLRDRVVEHLIRADFPVDSLVAALQGEKAWEALKGFGLEPLHQHCVSELEAELATPARSPDDWAIRAELRCACQLCARLSRFLAARGEVCLEWPLAKERRRHVHGQIDCHRLPVSHTTRRRGSPYTLVLKKTEALFARERERRGTLEKHLAWLNRHGMGGAGGRSRKGQARPRRQGLARASLPSSR